MDSKYLTEDDFISTLKGEKSEFIQNDRVFIKGYKIGPIHSSEIETKYSIYLEKCTFNDFFDLSINCKGKVEIKNCVFHEHFSILNSKCDSFEISNSQFSKAITIDNCSFTALKIDSESENPRLLISKSDFEGFTLSGNKYTDIHILNSFFKNSFLITKADVKSLIFSSDKEEKDSNKEEKNSNIVFQDSTFQDKISFEKGIFGSIHVKNCDCNNFSIDGGKFEAITVNNQDKIFKGVFNISGGDFKDDFSINGGKFEKEIKFDSGKFKNLIFKEGDFHRLLFRSGTFDGFISIRGGKYDDVTFKGGIYTRYVDFWGRKEKDTEEKSSELVIKRISIAGGDFKENIWIKDGKIEELNIQPLLMSRIHILPNDDRKYFLSIPQINILTIATYFYKDSFLQISDVSLKKLSFNNFTNMATITIANVNIEEEIEITNSDLGKTTFIDCDFSKITLKFKSSKITDMSVNGTSLPDNILTQDNSQKRLALSQIKKIYENRGDLVEAGKYQAQEMNVYLQTLPMSWEKINVCLNKRTNNHGQSWQIALGVTLVGSIFFYSIYCFFLGFKFDISREGLCEYGRLLCFLPEFINPIRKAEFLPKMLLETTNEPKVPSLVYLWDNISKIFITYFIYQFIAAFRKHGKKS